MEPPPPLPLFSTLVNKWATGAGGNEALETYGRSSHASADLSAESLDDIGRGPYKLLHSLAGRHAEGFDRLTLLAIDEGGARLDTPLHFLHLRRVV